MTLKDKSILGGPVSLYSAVGLYPKNIKTIMQFCIGFGIAILLILKVAALLGVHFSFLYMIKNLVELKTLILVGKGLEYSAGVELAYMLFTEGPDEAIDPVIMGVAAVLLLGLSKMEDLNASFGLGILLLVIALGCLFLIRIYTLEKWKNG